MFWPGLIGFGGEVGARTGEPSLLFLLLLLARRDDGERSVEGRGGFVSAVTHPSSSAVQSLPLTSRECVCGACVVLVVSSDLSLSLFRGAFAKQLFCEAALIPPPPPLPSSPSPSSTDGVTTKSCCD